MTSEVSAKADFSFIRYAQCWEDADILLEALRIQPHHLCLAIASAGDNVLAMASQGPQRVMALDLNPAQLACLALRVAAYRALDYPELLAFSGARPSTRRLDFYERCRPQLTLAEQRFWDAHAADLAQGFGTIGKFERYLRLFGTRLLPLLETPQARREVLKPRTVAQRQAFYARTWNNWRWRTLFNLFFSRRVMGWLGRDPEFFTYVETNVAEHLLARTAYALTTLDPAENPYLQWILLGRHGAALPYALRAEQFTAIRANLDRIEWRCQALEDFLQECAPQTIDGYNLSDIFEYMSPANYHALLRQLVQAGRKGGRLVYWNMLAARRRPMTMAQQLCPLDALAQQLYARDKAFFYSAFVVEEIL
jgi:S-adenosylmethionine-diacylglycerol 3-amino-3-carboxypropyl transferase